MVFSSPLLPARVVFVTMFWSRLTRRPWFLRLRKGAFLSSRGASVRQPQVLWKAKRCWPVFKRRLLEELWGTQVCVPPHFFCCFLLFNFSFLLLFLFFVYPRCESDSDSPLSDSDSEAVSVTAPVGRSPRLGASSDDMKRITAFMESVLDLQGASLIPTRPCLTPIRRP